MLFADASALIKRYVREPHSAVTRKRLAAARTEPLVIVGSTSRGATSR